MDSRPLKAILDVLAEYPTLVEAQFDPTTEKLTKLLFAPKFNQPAKKEVDITPRIAKGSRNVTAIDSLRGVHEGKMSSKPEPE